MEEETASEYGPVDEDLADVNDNTMAYSVTHDLMYPDLNHGAFNTPPGDRQSSPRARVHA